MDVFAVPGIPEVEAGDALAAHIEAGADPRDGDVVCVASTAVSKAEDRRADLGDFPAGPRAREIAVRLGDITGEEKDPRFAQAVLEESTDLLIEAPFLLTETRFGHVTVNAGIDRSNAGDADLLLLPTRPAASAARIREGLDADVAVIVTDTCGRPFRYGQRGVAIGWDGIPACRDWRGETDRDGYELGVTMECVVDELAAAANLVMGEGDGGTPAAIVRGFEFGNHAAGTDVFRDVDGDVVRRALRGWVYESPD